ncbi:MAG: T9SS type A sorting domain-containing protein [Chlorobi bacterium]|nr:T9SS type A sorting domain-containing protein [Chlorobiota bacterium]
MNKNNKTQRIVLLISILLINIFDLFGQSQFDTLFVREVGPGIHHIYIEEPNVPWTLNVLKINLKSSNLKIESVLGNDKIPNLERTSSMSARYNKDSHFVVGAINADFFDYNGRPVGMQIREGEVITPPDNWSAIGFDQTYTPFIERVSLQSNLITKNGNWGINGINKTRDADQLILYNSYFGNTTVTNIYGSEVTVQPLDRWFANDSTKCVVTNKISDQGNSIIQKGEAILSGHGAAKTFIDNNIQVGDTLIIYHQINSGPEKIATLVSGYPKIVSNGENCALDCFAEEGGSNSFATARHPRTAAGFSENGDYLYFVTVDGRQTISKGMSLSELADFMVGIGVYRGVNLDGGGSTTMVVRGNIANSPSDAGGERSVANSLMVVSTAPKGELSQIRLNTEFAKVFSDSTYKFSANGFDANFNSIPINTSNVIYSATENIGSISSDGFFTAASISDTGYVIAEYEGMKDSALVVINSIVKLTLSPFYSITDTSARISFNVKSYDLNGYEIDFDYDMFEWSTTDNSIGVIDSVGNFYGLKQGTTKVIVKWRNVSDTADVKVELGSGIGLLDSFESIDRWTLTGENIDTISSNIQLSNEYSTLGNNSLMLNYSFTYQNGVNNWAYLNKDFPIYGIPDHISMDILGNDYSHTAAFIVTNYNDEEFALLMNKKIDTPNVFDTLYANFDKPIALTENATFHFPLTIRKIALILGSDRVHGNTYEGSIYFDNLRLIYPDAVVSVEEPTIQPEQFILYQNYPNPFNPSTTIEYTIPFVERDLSRSNMSELKFALQVQLKVYDILGREVATLVNEQQQPGTYEVKFDASSMPSGIYIYKLSAGQFMSAKKMLLLK